MEAAFELVEGATVAEVTRAPGITTSRIRGGGVRSVGSSSGQFYDLVSRGETGRPKWLGFEVSKREGDVRIDPKPIIELGPAKPGAVTPSGLPALAAGAVLFADEMARYERSRVAAYIGSEEWAAWAEANGAEADVRSEAQLMQRRDVAVIEAVAAGIRLVVRADDKCFDQPERKRFRRMTKSH